MALHPILVCPLCNQTPCICLGQFTNSSTICSFHGPTWSQAPTDKPFKEKKAKMKPSEYFDLACLCMTNKFTLMVIGMPGGGKTEITIQAAEHIGFDVIITHPVIDDPTNYKGFPFKEVDADGNISADFVPFGMLRKLIEADRPTLMFMDDMGQAPKATQAAAMQLLWGGKLNGANISPHVSFIVASNRREDKAAVTGMIEPLKNRATIVHLTTNVDDWCKWAIENKQPPENIAFNRFRPKFIIEGYEPTIDFTNSATPRTIAKCGDFLKAGVPSSIEHEIYAGTAGDRFAIEFINFLQIYRQIPDIQSIIKNPDAAEVPTKDSILYATCEALAVQATKKNFGNILKFAKRLHEEFEIMLVRDAIVHNVDVCETKDFIRWQADHQDILLFTGKE